MAFLTKILEILVKVKNDRKYDNNDPKGQRVTKKLANVLCVGNLQLCIVDLPEFKDFVEELNPKANTYSRNKIRTEINYIFKELKDCIKKSIGEAKFHSLPIYIWTQIFKKT